MYLYSLCVTCNLCARVYLVYLVCGNNKVDRQICSVSIVYSAYTVQYHIEKVAEGRRAEDDAHKKR